MASNQRWKEQTLAAYRNFPYAPPEYPGAPFRARPPNPPYKGAEGWKCSVYYYWWEYLRRHEDYRATCERDGKGPYKELYKSFGNVHESDFHSWWWSHLHLFTFVSDAQRFDESSKFHKEYEGIFLHVGYSRSKTEMIANARTELMKLPQRLLNEELNKSIRFYTCCAASPKNHFISICSLGMHVCTILTLLMQSYATSLGLDVKLPYDPADIAEMQQGRLSVAGV